MLPINYYSKKRTIGLTLIEVLIALAIVSIALTAIIKAVSQNIRSTAYLEDKTVAMYVGQQVLNEARVGLFKPPTGVEKLQETTIMLGREWHWSLQEESTANPRIKKMTVKIFTQEPEEEDKDALLTLEGYIENE